MVHNGQLLVWLLSLLNRRHSVLSPLSHLCSQGVEVEGVYVASGCHCTHRGCVKVPLPAPKLAPPLGEDALSNTPNLPPPTPPTITKSRLPSHTPTLSPSLPAAVTVTPVLVGRGSQRCAHGQWVPQRAPGSVSSCHCQCLRAEGGQGAIRCLS